MTSLRPGLLALLAVVISHAATTTTWEMSTYQDFIKGRFHSVALDRDGRLTLAPKLDSVFASGQAVIWSVAKAPDGSVYLGTGHRGRVFRIARDGSSALIWTADQAEVFAVAVDPTGALYAATSPDGRIYRIEGGKAVEVFNPKAKYIWSLAFGSDGALYAGTGDPANVYVIDKSGAGQLYFATGQGHVTSLAVEQQGRLLAGTEPNGILYRISAKDKAFVLYDAALPEIRAIVPMPDGTVYAAALGGSVAKRLQSAQQAAQGGTGTTVTAPTTTITVEAQEAGPGPEVKPPDPTKPQPATAPAPQVTTQFTPVTETTGVDKSAVYRINSDNTVETLWSSKEENVYDLLALNRQLIFSTDENGRIYSLTPDRRVTLMLETQQGETTRLLSSNN